MNKKIGSILLVAGTCIGSGMIALPMVLAKIGLIPSILLMLIIWYTMYYTSLVNLELNLQAGEGLALGALGRLFSGKKAELIGMVSSKLLLYSMLSVFIYGGSSILQELTPFSFNTIAAILSLVSVGVLLLPLKLIDYCNRSLFVVLLGVIAILITGLALTVNWSEMPLFANQYDDPAAWAALIPVVFTSFGFQCIFHTLTNYCSKNVKMLKQAFFWGSFIPALVYILWSCSVLSVVYCDNPAFFAKMAAGKAEVRELIHTLSAISKWQTVQLMVWWISLLAIATSIIGVGVGLCDAFKKMLPSKTPALCPAVLTLLPPYLVVVLVPNAFFAALGFAGMILAIIAILLPLYLLGKIKGKYNYPELEAKWLILISLAVGVIVIASEFYNIT